MSLLPFAALRRTRTFYRRRVGVVVRFLLFVHFFVLPDGTAAKRKQEVTTNRF
jgi:hypothetical protein